MRVKVGCVGVLFCVICSGLWMGWFGCVCFLVYNLWVLFFEVGCSKYGGGWFYF